MNSLIKIIDFFYQKKKYSFLKKTISKKVDVFIDVGAHHGDTITEFLATGKTGVIYNLDQENLKHSDGEALLGFDNREYLKESFVHIDTPKELHAGIKLALKPIEEMKKAQKRDQKKIFYKLDGNASIRVKQIVEQLISDGIKI